MYKDTKNFVRSCTICLSRKNAFKIPPAPHQLVEQSTEPGETCHMDIFGPLKTTLKGNSYVLSMIDAFTKYIHIVPLPDTRSSTISKAFFDNYIVHRGCPHKLVVDNATYFKSSEFVEFCRVMGIQKRHISSYSAHVNGRVEKPNQSLANILADQFHKTQNDWDDQLPAHHVQHVEQLRKRFNTHVNRMIPFIKRFSYLHLKNLDDLQPDETEVKGIVPSPRFGIFLLWFIQGGIFGCRILAALGGSSFAPTAVATEIQQNFSDGFSFPTPCFLFLRYGAVAMRLGTHKFFGLKPLEEDRGVVAREFGSVGLGLGQYLSDDGAANIMDEHGQNPHKTWTAESEPESTNFVLDIDICRR
ncbi:gypsy retrotransposon integrase-like protein 1 [Trichonephila clavipes]|nr:gypsy retrotransposon integrase-like protein 1 [Trichonephila clavipes]